MQRQTMKKYWDEHSSSCSIEEMMLDENASKIEEEVCQ